MKNSNQFYKAVCEGMCPSCGTAISLLKFRDEEYRKEFMKSGICQECQDEISYNPNPRWFT